MKPLAARSIGFLLWQIILLAIGMTTGCQSKQQSNDFSQLPSRISGSSDAKFIAIQQTFFRYNVQVISIGQDYLITIPSLALFANQSSRMLWQGYDVLNKVVEYMHQFRMVGVNITGYSSKYKGHARQKALTSARAQAVADYLWSQGIDSRFIFADGKGSSKPIKQTSEKDDSSDNSRIEITFRDTIV